MNLLLAILLLATPVVRVESVERGSTSWGTGTCVAATDVSLVITARHVIQDGHEFKIDGNPARLIAADKIWDLAALTASTKIEAVNIAMYRPDVGDTLTVCGYGSGDYREATGTLLKYFSPGGVYPSDILSVSVAARNGDSGGPIFNTQGTLAAVLFGSTDNAHGSNCVQVRLFIEGLKIDPQLKKQALTPPYKIFRRPYEE
jgi:V8-like Glu-specific endopeptidase